MTTMISVSWVSFNNDPYERNKDGSYLERDGDRSPGPTLELLFNAASPVAGRIKRHYMLARRPLTTEVGGRRTHPREPEVAEELRLEIARRDGPDVEILWWDTDASPTDHRALFHFTAAALVQIRRSHPRAELVVNISPGTPAAQTVMLLALQVRIAGDQVRAVQGVPRDKRRDPRDVVRPVAWNLLAELAATPTEHDDPAPTAGRWTFAQARSRPLQELAALVERYAGVPFPVLLIGERGTGKTEVARALRDGFRTWLARPAAAWNYHLNCAEFRGDTNMLRSALFGEVKGAHSTAVKDKAGLLEEAADDCVFLDEIHWIDPHAQGLLLVALQRRGSLRRLGGERAIPAKFRLIAATNQPRHVLRDKLTPDFLDRIADLVIELPELRRCHEDLGEIWRAVVRRACEELVERDPARAGTGRVDALVAEFQPHHARIERALGDMRLPGNFRDLERLARRLLVDGLARGRFLSLGEPLVRAALDRARLDERRDADPRDAGDGGLVDDLPTLARCEQHLRDVRDAGGVFAGPAAVEIWDHRLMDAALAVGGTGAKAAELLGMPARTFTAKQLRRGLHAPQPTPRSRR